MSQSHVLSIPPLVYSNEFGNIAFEIFNGTLEKKKTNDGEHYFQISYCMTKHIPRTGDWYSHRNEGGRDRRVAAEFMVNYFGSDLSVLRQPSMTCRIINCSEQPTWEPYSFTDFVSLDLWNRVDRCEFVKWPHKWDFGSCRLLDDVCE
jgi:hypothetical protein